MAALPAPHRPAAEQTSRRILNRPMPGRCCAGRPRSGRRTYGSGSGYTLAPQEARTRLAQAAAALTELYGELPRAPGPGPPAPVPPVRPDSFVLGPAGLLVTNILLGPMAVVMATIALARSTTRRGRALPGLALGIADLVVPAVLVTVNGTVSRRPDG